MKTMPNAERKNVIWMKCMSKESWCTAADAATNRTPAAIIQTAPRIEPGRAANRVRGMRLKMREFPWSVGDGPGALYHRGGLLTGRAGPGL